MEIPMAMTPQEATAFQLLQTDVHELRNKVEASEIRWNALDTKVDKILVLVKGIAIGILIGGIIFGYFSIKDLIDMAK